jgi:hypothetical protein
MSKTINLRGFSRGNPGFYETRPRWHAVCKTFAASPLAGARKSAGRTRI